MSGINSRLIHDPCAISQKTATSCAPANYALFLPYNVNPNFMNPRDVPCNNNANTIGCAPCDYNTNAVLGLGPDGFVQRADIEANLRGIKRHNTRCANEKFMSCDLAPNATSRIQDECTNFITVNPHLCDRSIVPTNLKFPTDKGF